MSTSETMTDTLDLESEQDHQIVTSLRSALAMNTAQFRGAKGHPLDRLLPYTDWIEARIDYNLFPYSKTTASAVGISCKARDLGGRKIEGLNFASQDYLNLSAHPAIKEAAATAIEAYGVHSAGSSALMGAMEEGLCLEEELARFLGYKHCILFPTGWSAGFGVIKGLISPEDHIVIDQLAHACLQEGANAATKNVHRTRHLSVDDIARTLIRIRSQDSENGILVVTETLFSMDADTPDIGALVSLCKTHNAVLLVDVAHDLGSMAPQGGGVLESQNVQGQPHIVMGSFSKTFASNGGFVATSHPGLRLWLQYNSGPLTFSNTLSPIQVSVIKRALEIVRSSEGVLRRSKLLRNATYLRQRLEEQGFGCIGSPSPIVPVVLGNVSKARLIVRQLSTRQVLVNLKAFKLVFSKLLTAVRPGGELVIGNFSTDNPSRPYMEFAQWSLIHRDPQELVDLAVCCGIKPSQIEVRREPTGVNLFAHIKIDKDIAYDHLPLSYTNKP